MCCAPPSINDASLITIVLHKTGGNTRVGSIDGSKIQESKQILEEKGDRCQFYTLFYSSQFTHENKVIKSKHQDQVRTKFRQTNLMLLKVLSSL